eukprot:TRINITY_DN5415_c0_g1_i1.p1 TRINITY_DN5415_c0_g1~~TRINITY_DN5415_c0_g1_i1.p1  ORF type:complete len:739 (-),score=200.70 TRINITY_DN5415_c0_g1_i1:179-2104(-)
MVKEESLDGDHHMEDLIRHSDNEVTEEKEEDQTRPEEEEEKQDWSEWVKRMQAARKKKQKSKTMSRKREATFVKKCSTKIENAGKPPKKEKAVKKKGPVARKKKKSGSDEWQSDASDQNANDQSDDKPVPAKKSNARSAKTAKKRKQSESDQFSPSDEDDSDGDDYVPVKRSFERSAKNKKKPKSCEDSDEEWSQGDAVHNDDVEEFSINGEKWYKPRVGHKRKKNPDPDFDCESGDEANSDIEEETTEEGKRKYERSHHAVSEEEMPKDEAFLNGQQKVLLALQDENVDSDPRKLWHQVFGLSEHTRFSTLNPTMICPLCSLQFSSHKHGSTFFNHLQNHKIKTLKCSCLPTEAKGNIYAMRRHVQLVHWNYAQCNHCEDVVQPDKIILHSTKKHPSISKEILCTECGEEFTVANYHKYRYHVEKHKADRYECNCGVTFKTAKHRLHHVQTVHLKEMVGCDECHHVTYDRISLQHHKKKYHVEVREQECWICDTCGFETKNKYTLKNHKKLQHLDEGVFTCVPCNKTYNTEFKLKEHEKKCHRESVCGECGAKVKNLKGHIETVHTPDHLKRFQCTHCQKGFNAGQKLKAHIQSCHTKARPFRCRYGCDIGYNDRSNRNAHEKKKHGQLFTAVKDENSEL